MDIKIKMMRIAFYQTASGNSPVEKFIGSLPKYDQARLAEIYEGIIQYGFDYPRVVFKVIEGKLWEIKFRTKSGGHRIFYVLVDKDNMVWLHIFKKTTQKTPKKDIIIAKKRMMEVL